MIPANIAPKMLDIIKRVEAAFLALGFLKKGTALEIASTPVNEAEPEVKALKIRINDTPVIGCPKCAVAA